MPPVGFQSPARTRHVILCVKTWLSTLDTVSLYISDDTLKPVGPFYMVSMSGDVKYPTQGVNL